MSLSIWTTYWSIPTTFLSTNDTSGKYSADCANGLFAHADKCEFHITSCEYLGYMLSPDGLTMASNKIQIIQDWLEPC